MSGSLVKIDEEIITGAVSSVTLGNFSADFDVYKVVINDMQTSNDNVTAKLRFNNSSGAVTSSNYNEAYKFLRNNSSFVNVNQNGQTQLSLGGTSLGTNASENQQNVLHIYNAFNASEYTSFTQDTVLVNSSGYVSGAKGGGTLAITEQHLSILMYMETNNIDGGTFTLYGLKK